MRPSTFARLSQAAIGLVWCASSMYAQWSESEPLVAITSISPTQRPAGGSGFILTINGANFKPSSVVRWDGLDRVTHYQSASLLTADIASGDVASPRTVGVTVKQAYSLNTLTSNPGRFIVTFDDVPPGATYFHSINTIAKIGVTAGCDSVNYCPGSVLTRAQMSVLLLKAEHGSTWTPPHCTGVFSDVSCPSTYADWIEQLYRENITAGCGGTNFCPDASTRRDQMAVFVLKTRYSATYSPPACSGIFSDVACPGTFTAWVEDVYNRRIAAACQSGPLRYCPQNPVSRGEMAEFISNAWAFGLDATITVNAADSNYHVGAAYGGSVVKRPDVYGVFATSGLIRYQWDGTRWIDTISTQCPADPSEICHFSSDDERQKCGDAIYMFWKHIVAGHPNGADYKYNLFNGLDNYRCDPDPDAWPPPGLATPTWGRIEAINVLACGLPARPALTDCHPGNPNAYPTGTSQPKVVFVPTIGAGGEYLIAFNANVNFQGTKDNWRMLWSYAPQNDPSSWHSPTDYLFRSTQETTNCETGLLVEDIDYENNYAYVLVTSIDNGSRYLLRATLSAGAPYYSGWALATGVSSNGLFTWTAVTPGGRIDLNTGYPVVGGGAAFGRVWTSDRSAFRWVFAVSRPFDSGMDLYSTDSLARPPVRAWTANDTTGLSPSQYKWSFSFTKAGDQVPVNDIDMATPATFWMVSWTKSLSNTGDNKVDYRKVRLSVCGAPPFGICPLNMQTQ